jgi:hypothetical protein
MNRAKRIAASLAVATGAFVSMPFAGLAGATVQAAQRHPGRRWGIASAAALDARSVAVAGPAGWCPDGAAVRLTVKLTDHDSRAIAMGREVLPCSTLAGEDWEVVAETVGHGTVAPEDGATVCATALVQRSEEPTTVIRWCKDAAISAD